MLRELHISGLGVIEDLDLEFHAGLNVLSGETGAGKTMVTVGLSLALGGRGAASLVRDGAKAAKIQARFEPAFSHRSGMAPEIAAEIAAKIAEWVEDGELILARTVAADGRGSARIGGQLTTTSALAELGGALVEVHGQHQAHRLLSAGTQTAFLDRFAGEVHLVGLMAYRESYERLRASRSALEDLRDASRDRERELDLLAYQAREIEAVGPRAGETADLVAEEAKLSHVERLLELAGAAEDALGADEGVGDALSSAARALDDAVALDPEAADVAARASALSAELAELHRDVRRYRESLLVEPDRLQAVRERISSLRSLQRKYGETDLDVLAYLSQASERLAELAGADDRLEALEAEVSELVAASAEQAARIRSGRVVAAPELAGALAREVNELGMPGAMVEVGLEPLEPPGPGGSEWVELRLAAGPGQSPVPLAKTASGGELSRTMLACRSVLADLDNVPTIVFDEVDAGIGGQAGLAVGRRLALLARERQVLVVTHLPQIACFADRHIRVRKAGGVATVEALDDEERIRELSRMLAGLDQSQSAVSHAEELLTEAARVRAG